MPTLKIELQKIENEVLQVAIKEQLKQAYIASEEDLEYVKEEFTNFCKNQQLKKALMTSVDLLKSGDFEEIRVLVDNALKAGQDKNIGHDYLLSIEDRYRPSSRVVIPTPWPVFNKLLQGGLGNGDLGLVFGNPGGGKSWTLVGLGGYAVKMGYNVLHYTLELGEEYVAKRYDAYFTGVPVNLIEGQRQKVEDTLSQLKGNLIIKEYPMKRASVSTIEAHIQKCEDLGVKPDLIIIDYLDLLSGRNKNAERKDEVDDIYTSTKGLARQLDLPIWSVSQVNRSGAQDKVIEGDKAAGSYDKMMIADFSVSLSRQKEDKVNQTGRFHIMKNRYGTDGLTYPAQVNTSNGHFDILDEMWDESNDIPEGSQPSSPKSPTFSNELSSDEKSFLREKFFELK